MVTVELMSIKGLKKFQVDKTIILLVWFVNHDMIKQFIFFFFFAGDFKEVWFIEDGIGTFLPLQIHN